MVPIHARKDYGVPVVLKNGEAFHSHTAFAEAYNRTLPALLHHLRQGRTFDEVADYWYSKEPTGAGRGT